MTIVGANLPSLSIHGTVPSAQVKSALLLAGLNVPGDTIITETEKTKTIQKECSDHLGQR